MYPAHIDGDHVVLRDFESDDLDATMRVVGDPDVVHHLSFDTRTREQQAELLAADIERARAEPRPDYYLAVIEKATRQLIGFVRIGLMRHQAGELGYATRKDRWRAGLTTEAARMMLEFGFTTLGLHRIQAACGPQNIGSQALLEKLGFQREGRIRDHVFTNGAWRDSLLYSILDSEWHAA